MNLKDNVIDNKIDQPNWIQNVEALASKACEACGCILYDLEFQGLGKGRVLRVFVDKEESLVGIEDCTAVTHALNEALDKDENLIPGGEYNLEVSTPGIDRVLKKPWHFEKAVGKKIWIKTGQSFDTFGVTSPLIHKSKQIESLLEEVADGQLVFKNKDGKFQIPMTAIEKAHVVFEMKKGSKK